MASGQQARELGPHALSLPPFAAALTLALTLVPTLVTSHQTFCMSSCHVSSLR
jgi:hypothetical protein